MVTGKLVNNAWHHADGCMHVLVAICIVTRPAVTPLANIMTTIPVYQLEKVDRGLDKDAAAVRDQKLSETGFSYPADVPSSETNYTFYAIKESDRKPVLIGTGDIVVSRDGTFFYIADNSANPTLQFKDAKDLEGNEAAHKIIGLGIIAPPPQDKTRGERQADDAANYQEVEP